ncbi:Imm21 family immunity protein [Streptomyces caniscabiei]|uniref:Imm21 family immunity protein n=1 Tax=Streptomyces caniscabiei TaxID=2746961 RepID=UPI0029ADBCEE|nr:Imm21 family immunity protein [Streptomyces caniscabiei]MDX2606002.1 Imm21 family immunity protein [Streptomyces caniscabiei]MDX2735385.1 Imm21 family immunity protein [Streptomyces caniscabiei]MDX2779078.1 Imm21 family immunity protein [Streptomyces caniscabiei]
MAGYADAAVVPDVVRWVKSSGGPLMAIPEAVLAFWAGADGDETSSDYDRACDIDGPVGLLPVGDTRALVLGDEPAPTAYLPGPGVFVRCYAADFETELLAGVPAALETAAWEPELRWRVPGPVVLLDAVRPGRSLRETDHVRVELTAGAYTVCAARVTTGPQTSLGFVRVRPLADR